MPQNTIRIGIGGWTFEPWRDNFYPKGLPHADELAFASRALRTIEINGTYYRLQKPATFAGWRDATPDGFVFSVKASRFVTNRSVLAEAGESMTKFVDSGIAELGDRLGPVVWQFAPTKRYDPDDFGAFLALLPKAVDGVPLRHAVEVRHDSFRDPGYLALARRHGVATVFTDSDDYPSFADLTGDFVYARVMRTSSSLPDGVADADLDAMAACAQVWRDGGEPAGVPRIEAAGAAAAASPRDVFIYFISAAKEKAPAAAVALQRRIG